MNTAIWGELFWSVFDELAACCCKGTPMTEELEIFCFSMKYLLPCCHCRKSYERFIASVGNVKMDRKARLVCKRMGWREEEISFAWWVFVVHRHVNKKLKKKSIKFNQYLMKISMKSGFCGKKDLFDFLFILAFSFDKNKETEKAQALKELFRTMHPLFGVRLPFPSRPSSDSLIKVVLKASGDKETLQSLKSRLSLLT